MGTGRHSRWEALGWLEATAKTKATAGPSTSLRMTLLFLFDDTAVNDFAQDDRCCFLPSETCNGKSNCRFLRQAQDRLFDFAQDDSFILVF
jgi:hypothetical protein